MKCVGVWMAIVHVVVRELFLGSERAVSRLEGTRSARRASEVTPDHVAALHSRLFYTAAKSGEAPAAALRMLMLTGCQRNEIVTLKWEHVDFEDDELHLGDAKTGSWAVPLSPAAKQVQTALPHRPDNPWVFPGRVRGTRLLTPTRLQPKAYAHRAALLFPPALPRR